MHSYLKTTGKAVFLVMLVMAPMSVMANNPGIDNISELQQSGKVSGVIKDAKTGEPLIGVSIMVNGGSEGTITDIDGNFSLKVTAGTPLTISYVGYKTKQLKAGPQMMVKLEEDSEVLDEVVVVGYGTQKKVNLSGSVASVDV